jgi:hypothetical protein
MVVKFLAFVLRVYSFVFHLTLSTFLTGVGVLAYRSHQPLSLGMLPFDEEHLVRDTTLLGAAGIVCTMLAFTRSFKFIFVIWTVVILFMMVNGFFVGPYVFHGMEEMKGAAWLSFGAVGAFFGAAWSLKTQRRGRFL